VVSWLLSARPRLVFARSSLLPADKGPALDARDSAVDVKVDERVDAARASEVDVKEADARASEVDVKVADARDSGLHEKVSGLQRDSSSK